MLLPQVAAFLQVVVPDAMSRVARALNTDSAAAGPYELAERLDAPLALKDIGMAEADLDEAVRRVAEHTGVASADIRRILQAARNGDRPH